MATTESGRFMSGFPHVQNVPVSHDYGRQCIIAHDVQNSQRQSCCANAPPIGGPMAEATAQTLSMQGNFSDILDIT